MNSYAKFALMMTVSFCVMYAVMFLNVSAADHIYLSSTRLYMTLLMVAPMAVLMMGMMWKMYPNKKVNVGVIGISVLVFILSLTFLRNQTFIGDEQYMRAMIPHHSSAIMTSQNAQISDPELRKLADEIIAAQVEEIAQMKNILHRLDEKK